MAQLYDTLIIGAGIAGCCSAYALQQKGQKVLLLDRSSVPASGGSGAAGAFVSPKIGKGSPLQSLTTEAFHFSKAFYLRHFPDYFDQTGVVRIPKDEADAQKFATYEPHNNASYQRLSASELSQFGIRESEESFYFEEAGVCDAPALCEAILKQVPHAQHTVEGLVYEAGVWVVGEYRAKAVVLATGYQNQLVDMRYMGVKGTWGSRGDYYSRLALTVSMHKRISISANQEGVIKLGATHVKSPTPCQVCDGHPLKSLEEQASRMVDTRDFTLKETFCGMRAGSKDYFPLVGRVIDVAWMLEQYPTITRGAKPPLHYHPNLFVCNGVGGRGFVFAPWMAEELSELIVKQESVDPRVNPDRLFLKWCRKSTELVRE